METMDGDDGWRQGMETRDGDEGWRWMEMTKGDDERRFAMGGQDLLLEGKRRSVDLTDDL